MSIKDEPAREICNAILELAVKQDEYLHQISEEDRIDDKTVFIISAGEADSFWSS